MLTLRQIEVIRAIMVAGTVNGAAELLNVSAPGVSRVMKHAESVLGIRLFSRRHGRFAPTPEARNIFDQINEVYQQVENLQDSIVQLKRGESTVFSFATVPSISQSILPRSVTRLRHKYQDLVLQIDTVKIEEAVNYLLLKRGELVALSYAIDHPGLICHEIGEGSLLAIMAEGHPLAERPKVSIEEMADFPLIGFDPEDPYGAILASVFADNGVPFDLSIRVRFSHALLGLVRQNLGVAVIDEFSVAENSLPGIVRRPIAEPTTFKTYAALSADSPESIFAEDLVKMLREEMRLAVENRPWLP